MTMRVPSLKISSLHATRLKTCLVALTGLVILVSCQTNSTPQNSNKDALTTISASSINSNNTTGCLAILNNYCSQLYAPNVEGNLVINRSNPISILQGETHNNLPYAFHEYSKAKLYRRKMLPHDFVANLDRYSYFEKLESFLNRKPIHKMDVEDRISDEHLNYELGSIWTSALNQTVIQRMTLKHKDFHKIPGSQVPLEIDIEQRRMQAQLAADISKIIWRDNDNWKRVQRGFLDLKTAYQGTINRLDIPENVRDTWKTRIASIELIVPGSIPEIAEEECATTLANAYYFKNYNVITVCAGDFNTEDIIMTLAHEIGHSLDIDRDMTLFTNTTKIKKDIDSLKTQLCERPHEFKCESWQNFKKDYSANLQELDRYTPPLVDFQRCLKRSENTKHIEDLDLKRLADKATTNRVANLAYSAQFLRLIKKEIPYRNGKSQTNPNYLNPCKYYLWNTPTSLDDELMTLLFFTAEYRCNKSEEKNRLEESIDSASGMTEDLLYHTMKLEGEFSDRHEMVVEGFSSPPIERFADVIGSYALAEYLNRYENTWDKRSKFLASATWLCQEPSLESIFPDESRIEKLYSFESHSEGEERKMEILSHPIRETLKCEHDFKFKECSLPFKDVKAGQK